MINIYHDRDLCRTISARSQSTRQTLPNSPATAETRRRWWSVAGNHIIIYINHYSTAYNKARYALKAVLISLHLLSTFNKEVISRYANLCWKSAYLPNFTKTKGGKRRFHTEKFAFSVNVEDLTLVSLTNTHKCIMWFSRCGLVDDVFFCKKNDLFIFWLVYIVCNNLWGTNTGEICVRSCDFFLSWSLSLSSSSSSTYLN